MIVLLLVGSLYSPNFLSPEYLLQQLKVASFLGVIATGMFIVILLGQIDLSAPWVVAMGGMMSAAVTAYGPVGPGAGDSVRRRLRRGARVRQRRRRRLSAHPLDDHHAGDQCGRAGVDGRPHRRLLAAGFRLPRDAFHCDRRDGVRAAQRAHRLGAGRRRRGVPASQPNSTAATSTRSAIASGRPISPASIRGAS